MNRKEVVAGSCVALLAGLAVGQLYVNYSHVKDSSLTDASPAAPSVSREPPAAAPAPATIDDVVDGFMDRLTTGSQIDRSVAFEDLLDELETAPYSSQRLSADTAEPLAEAAVDEISQTGDDGPASVALKERLAGFVAGRTRGQASRQFVLKTLDQGPADLRLAIVDSVGAPQGVVGKDVFDRIQKLAEDGAVPAERAVPAMRRTSSARAKPAVLALMRSTDSVKAISACAVTLQDYQDPELLGAVLERLEQTGTLDKPAQLPWISPRLLSLYLKTADGSALGRGLKVIRTRPALAKNELPALEKGVADAQLRDVAVTAVRNAVLTKVLAPEQGEKLLAVSAGQPQVLKAELNTPQPVKAQ